MTDLPEDLIKEIFSRVPLTSLSAVRSTCKKWNSISKSQVLCESSARRKKFLGFMMKDFRVCSMKFDLQGIQNEADFVDPSIKQVSVLEQVEISQIFQCEGLLLCVTSDKSRLLVWNPYLGQMNWTQQRNNFHNVDKYALGYDKNRNHKILRIFGKYGSIGEYIVLGYEIFYLSSNTLKVYNVNADWLIDYYQSGVSLKGHTYFLAEEKTSIGGYNNIQCILSFNYTTERFGKLLPLPFKSQHSKIFLSLSCVRDEQLAVLQERFVPDHALEIWVTNKIDQGAVSWSKFLSFTFDCKFGNPARSFFIDEEKRVAVALAQYEIANIIGQDGYFKCVNMGEKRDRFEHLYELCCPYVCSSYVPSSVQLQTNQPN